MDTQDIIKNAITRLDSPYWQIEFKDYTKISPDNCYILESFSGAGIRLDLVENDGVKIGYNDNGDIKTVVVKDAELLAKFHKVRNHLWDELVESNER